MMDVADWLRQLGLERYEAAFRENDIDETVLPSLSEEHLKQLGVTALGHRLKLLDAIAALRGDERQHSLSPIAAPARFVAEERGTNELKGVPEPVTLFRLGGRAAADGAQGNAVSRRW